MLLLEERMAIMLYDAIWADIYLTSVAEKSQWFLMFLAE